MIDFSAKIKAIEYCLGEICESNSDLKSENPEWDIEKIEKKTGVSQRWVAKKTTTSLDLAFQASEKLFNYVNREEVDTLILVTQSPDYFLPTSACILQEKLSLSKSTKCFDVSMGCSGFIYGLSIASSFIESGLSKNVLLLCADTYSKFIEKNDRTNRPIFSDAASATLLIKDDQKKIGPFLMGTDGSGHEHLIVANGAARSGFDYEGTKPKIHMNGSSVFMFTMSQVPLNIITLLKDCGLSIEEIDMFVFHQASKIVLDTLKEKLKINDSNFFCNSEKIGNTVSSSIPIALKEADELSMICDGDQILISGFGVGLSWGSCIINWSKLS